MALHADTTVIASRVYAQERRREAAREALNGKQVHLCGFVVQELRATFLRDAVLLYRLVKDSPDVWEALMRLGNYQRTRRERRATDIFATAMRQLFAEGRAEATKQAMLDYLEVLIEGEMMRQFYRGLEIAEHDNLSCHRADNVGSRIREFYQEGYRCTHPDCGLEAFLRSCANQVAAVAESPENVEAEVRSKAADAAWDPTSVRTTDCYGSLADLIITLECPSGALVCTTNMSDFIPLCSALGLPRPVDASPDL